jgi:hypothetical protein
MSAEKRARHASVDSTGVVVAARMGEISRATREVRDGARQATEQRGARERQTRLWRMTDGGVVVMKPGNAGGAKAPCFRANVGKQQDPGD